MPKEIKILKQSEYKFNANGYGGRMVALTEDGAPAFFPTSCKEEFYYSIAKNTAYFKHRYSISLDCMPGNTYHYKIDRKHPTFVYYVSLSIDRMNAAERINSIMCMLCERMRLDEPQVSLTDIGQCILISLPRIFIRSPYAASAALTFIRSAAETSFPFSSLTSYIDELLKLRKSNNDAHHLWSAICVKNTFEDFLDKKLPCMKRRGFGAFKRGYIQTDFDIFVMLHGLATYSSLADETEYEKINFKEIKKLWVDFYG